MDKEYEKWLRVDPALRFPRWIRSEEGQAALYLSIGAGLYLLVFMVFLFLGQALSSTNGR